MPPLLSRRAGWRSPARPALHRHEPRRPVRQPDGVEAGQLRLAAEPRAVGAAARRRRAARTDGPRLPRRHPHWHLHVHVERVTCAPTGLFLVAGQHRDGIAKSESASSGRGRPASARIAGHPAGRGCVQLPKILQTSVCGERRRIRSRSPRTLIAHAGCSMTSAARTAHCTPPRPGRSGLDRRLGAEARAYGAHA